MAEYKTTVALEIGAQSVTMGVFTPSGRGYALSNYARRDVLLDPVEEGMRMDYVSAAIAEMVAELKVKGSDVRNVVSGQQVYMRFIKLPMLDLDDLEEQVGYEAQQHIPFPLEEIIYSYQELADRGEGEREVLLVAIKKDVLDNLNTQVEGNGLKTVGVDCSITSLYNAFRVSYPEETEPVMILDIGAKTTDIIFSETGRFFTRSVTAAGAFITNSICREFGLSYRDAEKLKIENGVVSLGNGHTDSMTEQDAALATTIRNAMGRLCSEVQRTINHYRAQFKGTPPKKVYICGGGSRLPYIVEFLQSALNLPVEYMNPLGAFAIGNKVDEEALGMDALCLGGVAGAAVTGAKAGEFDIDLVPTSVGKERAELELLPKVAVAGLIALAGAGIYAYANNSAATELEAEVARAQAAQKAPADLAGSIESRYSSLQSTQAKTKEIADLYSGRMVYADLLRQISESTASVKFWISEFAPLINYDVMSYTLENQDDVPGTRLIDMRKSASGSADSSINLPPEALTAKARKQAPAVTAIYVSGFTFKDLNDSSDQEHRQRIYNLVDNKFDERTEDSPFSFLSRDVQANRNRFFQFHDSKSGRSKTPVPEYLERFMMVMPLKQPIAIPELAPATK